MKVADIQHGRTSQRWAFLEGLDVGIEGDPYLDRLRLVQTPWFGVYLHHIHRPDRDPDPHDHPWAFASIVLAGWYRELVWPDKKDRVHFHERWRTRWSARGLGRRAAHTITDMGGPLWTLVLTGPRRGGPDSTGGHWGFWTRDGYVPWRDYIAGDARRAADNLGKR